MRTTKDWRYKTRHISPMTAGTDISLMVAELLKDLEESQNETAALRDALNELKQFVDGKRNDAENIAQILSGAQKLNS